jgi:hypothetical protein
MVILKAQLNRIESGIVLSGLSSTWITDSIDSILEDGGLKS